MSAKYLLIVLLFGFTSLKAQEDTKLIQEKLNISKQEKIGETMLLVGKSFLGKPYVASTLEGPEEKLVCNLNAFDCYTFVENVLALSLSIHKNKSSSEYLDILKKLRYRNGDVNGYDSRIHYFFDWVKQAEKNNIVQDISTILGVKNDKKINFMSQHRKYYSAFATDDEMLNKIIIMENNLAKYPFYYIPQASFETYKGAIKNGDIIAFTSIKQGLDVNHEGLAIWQNGELHLMHASLDFKKVIISTESLGQYLKNIKNHNGIMIVRSKQP